MNQYGNDYIEEIQNEHQRSFEFDEYPQFQEYYSNQISSGFKKPTKIIVTEIYDEKIPLYKNNMRRKEYLNYYSGQSSPYSNYNEYHRIGNGYHRMAQKKLLSQDKNIYLSERKDINVNSNYNDYYSDYNKQLYFGGTDLREEYSSPSNNRVNIRKKVHRGSTTPQPIRNYYTLRNDEDFLENFQYYESKNIKDKNNKKYQSITRVTGYSNLIPLNNKKLENNLTNINYNNVNISRYKNLNQELQYNYNKKEKPQTPEIIRTTEIIEETKKSIIPKETDTSIKNTTVQVQNSRRKHESTKLPQTTTNISKTRIQTTSNKYESIKLPETTSDISNIVKSRFESTSIPKTTTTTTSNISNIVKSRFESTSIPKETSTTSNIVKSRFESTSIPKTTSTTSNIVKSRFESTSIPKTTSTTSNIVKSRFETTSIPKETSTTTDILKETRFESSKKAENIGTTSYEDIIKKLDIKNTRSTTPSVQPHYKINIDTSKYNTNSDKYYFRRSIGKYKYKSNISDTDIINSRKNNALYDAKNVKKLDIVEKNSKPKENKNISNISKVNISNISTKYNKNDNSSSLSNFSSNIVKNRFDSLNSNTNYNNLSNLRLNENKTTTKTTTTTTEVNKIDINEILNNLRNINTDNNITKEKESYKSINIKNINSNNDDNIIKEKESYKSINIKNINSNIDNNRREKESYKSINIKDVSTNNDDNIIKEKESYKSIINIKDIRANNNIKENASKYLNRNYENNIRIHTYNQGVELEPYNNEYNSQYMNINEQRRDIDNRNIGYYENKKMSKIVKKKKVRQTTPKMKMKKKLLGDNYKYYESKFMLNPNENTSINSYTLHQRRNERKIYGNEFYEEKKIIKKSNKLKPKKKGYRAKSKKIIKKSVRMPNKTGEEENYIIYNKYYEGNYCDGDEEEYEEHEEGNNYGQREFYYQ